MPYKNIEDRRKCWKRWKHRNPEKHKENSRRQKQASSLYPVREACSVYSCGKIGERHHPDNTNPKEIVWLCKLHHEEVHITPVRYCKVDFCERVHHAKGLCNKHLKRWLRGQLKIPARHLV